MKYPLLKPKLFRIEMLSHDSGLKPADEVLESITETLFANSVKTGRKVRCYVRIEYGDQQPGGKGAPGGGEMNKIFIVPDVLSQQIYAKVDAQIALHPDSADDREAFYEQLLGFFNQHGFVPDFTLELKEPHCSCGDRDHPCVEHPDIGVN